MSHPSKSRSAHKLSMREVLKILGGPAFAVLVTVLIVYLFYFKPFLQSSPAISITKASGSEVAPSARKEEQEAKPSLLGFFHLSLPLSVIILEFYMLSRMAKESV